jgi:hemoglobin
MKYTITPAVFGERQNVEAIPDPRVLKVLSEEGMRALISRHYDLLAESDIKLLFPPTEELLEIAKKHSADFFIQICGGPKYFNESRGAPRMVARHMPFRIDAHARIVWLETFSKALEETNLDDELKTSFWNYIDIFSTWMINTPDK